MISRRCKNRRYIWECKNCERHCTTHCYDDERPPNCLYWRTPVWVRKDKDGKEKIIKEYPRECDCGGRYIPIYRARRGEDPSEYAECMTCKKVIV